MNKPASAKSQDLLQKMSRAASALSSKSQLSEPDTEQTLLIKKLARRVAEHVFKEEFDSNKIIKQQQETIDANAKSIAQMKENINKLQDLLMFSVENNDKKGSVLNGITEHVLNNAKFEQKMEGL